MTIDEAIQHCRGTALSNAGNAIAYLKGGQKMLAESCEKCAAEHEQLAKWLEELKQRRDAERWIPCSERMPENCTKVLVWFEYFRYGEYNCMYSTWGIGEYFDFSGRWLIDDSTGWQDLHVFAWMPMPDAYEPPEKE